jgi:hypothetical protein
VPGPDQQVGTSQLGCEAARPAILSTVCVNDLDLFAADDTSQGEDGAGVEAASDDDFLGAETASSSPSQNPAPRLASDEHPVAALLHFLAFEENPMLLTTPPRRPLGVQDAERGLLSTHGLWIIHRVHSVKSDGDTLPASHIREEVAAAD